MLILSLGVLLSKTPPKAVKTAASVPQDRGLGIGDICSQSVRVGYTIFPQTTQFPIL